jgi:hypothetical protein
MKKYQFELFELCYKVSQLTDINNHGEAKVIIAKYFGFNLFVQKFELINKYHNLDGHLCTELQQLRDRLTKELFNAIHLHHGEEVRQKVYNAL